MDNLTIFYETMQIVHQGNYDNKGQVIELKLSKNQFMKAIYLSENNIKSLCKKNAAKGVKLLSKNKCRVRVINSDSVEAAIKMMDQVESKGCKVLVLNFANPISPGGGVRYGANAQEEDLCRKSTLLFSLESEEASSYYDYHERCGELSTHSMILSPNVEIIRDSQNNLLSKTRIVSVLTCAAPVNNFSTKKNISKNQYEKLLYERISYILFVARNFGYQHLILGAWGCGAFSNDAKVVAKLFKKALSRKCGLNYDVKDCFRSIDFAILCDSSDMYNFECFKSVLNDLCDKK